MTIALSARRGASALAGIVSLAGLIIAMMYAAPSAHALTERHYCWGKNLEGGVTHLCMDETFRNIYAIYGGGTKRVCAGAWGVNGACVSGPPSEGVYIGSPYLKGEATRAYIYNKENSTTKSTVYGVLWDGPAPPPPPTAEGRWFLTNQNQTGVAENDFLFGGYGLIPVTGDWNGDGIDTPGAYDPATGYWYLRNSNTEGAADITFSYGGGSGMKPVAGDWNGDGVDTPGLFIAENGHWFLRNSNTSGVANIEFVFGGGSGASGMKPLAGDWNGDGIDTPGLYKPKSGIDEWYLRNSNTTGAANIEFGYGSGTVFKPVVGDWNGNGIDTPGLYDHYSGGWFLTNSLLGGVADNEFIYGGGSETTPIAGDFNGSGSDSISMVH